MLGGMDDKPAEIKANGGKPPVILNYGVPQPGYAIVARKEMVEQNPDLVRRFVKATLEAVKAAQANPDESIQALINWSGSVEDQKAQAREVLDVTLSILKSPNNTGRPHRLQRPGRLGERARDPQEVQGAEDRPAGLGLLHQRVHPAGELSRACPSPSTSWVRPRPSATDATPFTPSARSTCGSKAARSWRCSGRPAAARARCS